MVRHRARNRPRQPCSRRQVAHRAGGAGAVSWQKAATILDRDPPFIDVERPFIYRVSSLARADRPADAAWTEVSRPARDPRPRGCRARPHCRRIGRQCVAVTRHVDRVQLNHQLDLRRTLTGAPKQMVIVAAGAMGNAQLFLQPRSDGGVPVGNESGMVGLHLMEHPGIPLRGRVRDGRRDGPLLAGGQQGHGHARRRRGPGVLNPARTLRVQPAMLSEKDGRPRHGAVSLEPVRSAAFSLRHHPAIRNAAVCKEQGRPDRGAQPLGTPSPRGALCRRCARLPERRADAGNNGETLIRLGRGRVRV